ncbi:MAG TPA: peptide-methionine (S)-S-oxide reductase, partial [Rhodanobacteraceae bacterium]|nr:peptide-methionine (S)-S-oxide reductase [Rhodanobacteraceae bacterium]
MSTTQRTLSRGARIVAMAALLLLAACARSGAEEAARAVPPPAIDEPASGAGSETAVLAGGCFWGVQG